MGTSYLEVYSRFTDEITDYYLFDLSDEDACDYCHRLLKSAVATAQEFINELTMDDENYCFTSELENVEMEYLACAMTVKWVSPQLQNTILTKQYLGTKDEKFYSQANQIEQLRALRDDNVARTKKIRRDYNYSHNDYFNDN